MPLFLLDTDTVSLLERRHPGLRARVAAHDPAEISTTVITVEEQMTGRLAQIRRGRTAQEAAVAYAWLALTMEALRPLSIATFTQAAIARYEALKSLKLGVGKMDLRIAAIALEHGATVVTRNVRDFARVPSLTIENWAD